MNDYIDLKLRIDEKILWKQSKYFNLLKNIRGISYVIIAFNLILYLIFPLGLWVITNQVSQTSFMVIRVFSIVGTLILFVFGIQSYYRTKKIFRNHQNLKDYEGYEIFTNQRYIEKNPSKFLYRKRDFTCYRKDSYELNSDLLSIDFDKIDYIVYNDILNVILFMTELHLEKYKDYASLSDYASQKLDYREEFIFLELEGRKESAAMHIMALLQENVSIQRKIKVDRGIILVLG